MAYWSWLTKENCNSRVSCSERLIKSKCPLSLVLKTRNIIVKMNGFFILPFVKSPAFTACNLFSLKGTEGFDVMNMIWCIYIASVVFFSLLWWMNWGLKSSKINMNQNIKRRKHLLCYLIYVCHYDNRDLRNEEYSVRFCLMRQRIISCTTENLTSNYNWWRKEILKK